MNAIKLVAVTFVIGAIAAIGATVGSRTANAAIDKVAKKKENVNQELTQVNE